MSNRIYQVAYFNLSVYEANGLGTQIPTFKHMSVIIEYF